MFALFDNWSSCSASLLLRFSASPPPHLATPCREFDGGAGTQSMPGLVDARTGVSFQQEWVHSFFWVGWPDISHFDRRPRDPFLWWTDRTSPLLMNQRHLESTSPIHHTCQGRSHLLKRLDSHPLPGGPGLASPFLFLDESTVHLSRYVYTPNPTTRL